MATESSTFHSPTPTQACAREDNDELTPSRPLSRPGTSRQNRRLQLRNAGFRGGTLPSRKVTPKSMSSSTWSSVSGVHGLSDAENVSPSGAGRSSASTAGRRSSGVLQEIGNSSHAMPKKARQRVSSSKLLNVDHLDHPNAFASTQASLAPAKSTIRPRAVKNRAKTSYRRRSVSGETSKYIDHLEAELAETQSQLSSITSPSVTRVQTSKMRDLNTESRQLQEELAEWETKYEQRVQEEIDKHYEVETGLRARVRALEQDAEETQFRMQELETQLQSTTENMEAVETANVNLEKRIEIMSELLASTKIDLHAQTPGRGRKHVRPKSMLPRFPTASSLVGSPERLPQTQPTSPLLAFTHHPLDMTGSPSHSNLPPNDSPEHSDVMSEAESVFSEVSAGGDSMTSAENVENQTNLGPWGLPVQQAAKTRPMRRMRRFGAGSVGPKPLILASTSHGEQFPPSSAPPLERSETTPAFFPLRQISIDEADSPFSGRHRASTVADETTLTNLAASRFLRMPQQGLLDDTMVGFTPPNSAGSHGTTRRLSSLGSATGRNLMEELCAIRSDETVDSSRPSTGINNRPHNCSEEFVSQGQSEETAEDINTPSEADEDFGNIQPSQSGLVSPSSVTAVPNHRPTRSRSVSITTIRSTSIFERIRILFGDLWRSPVAMARYLVQKAQARLRIPRPLINVQWWLVGVLLGPMARRRMLRDSVCCGDIENPSLLLRNTSYGSRESHGDGVWHALRNATGFNDS